MNVRIVVADERKANFFDASKPDAPLTARGSIENEVAGLKDTDLETDRPGRRYGGTSGVSHGSGPTGGHHHGVDGERSTEQHELTKFAKEIAQRIDKDRVQHEFDKLVLVAPPKMLGLLRQQLPAPVRAMLAGEIAKNIINHDESTLINEIPREAFDRLQ